MLSAPLPRKVLFPVLGDGMPASAPLPAVDDSGGKVGDLAMFLSVVSSLVLIFRK